MECLSNTEAHHSFSMVLLLFLRKSSTCYPVSCVIPSICFCKVLYFIFFIYFFVGYCFLCFDVYVHQVLVLNLLWEPAYLQIQPPHRVMSGSVASDYMEKVIWWKIRVYIFTQNGLGVIFKIFFYFNCNLFTSYLCLHCCLVGQI